MMTHLEKTSLHYHYVNLYKGVRRCVFSTNKPLSDHQLFGAVFFWAKGHGRGREELTKEITLWMHVRYVNTENTDICQYSLAPRALCLFRTQSFSHKQWWCKLSISCSRWPCCCKRQVEPTTNIFFFLPIVLFTCKDCFWYCVFCCSKLDGGP